MAKSKVFWVTRDNDDHGEYEIWPYRAHPKSNDGWYPSGCSFGCCLDDFQRITGITLKPGEKKKFRLVEG